MPVRFVELTTLPALLISLVALAVWARSSGLHRRKLTAAGGFILLVLIGILINSAVTGAVSTPHHRYQMRVIWLVPLMALAVWVRLQPRSIRSEAAPEPGAA